MRDAVTEDVPRITRLLGDPEVGRWLSVSAATDVTEAISDHGDHAGVVVLEQHGEAVAVARWTTRNQRSRIAVVHGLAVDPVHRGQGHAARLVSELVDELSGTRDMHRVEAEAFAANVAALATFERCGFQREGVRRQAYDRDGAWQDSVLLARLSDAPRSPAT